MKLYYYAHRFRDPDPVRQQWNLSDAKERFARWAHVYCARDVILQAPWIPWAEAGLDEELAWHLIESCVRVSSGIVLDLDGAEEPSPGMVRERHICLAVGGKVEVVR